MQGVILLFCFRFSTSSEKINTDILLNNKMLKNLIVHLFLLTFFFMLGGCTTPIGTTELKALPEIVTSLNRYTKDYRLQSGDRIEVFVYRHDDFSKVGTIRPDGYLTLPVLDDIKAVGLTPMELDFKLTEALSKRLKQPEVTVFVENVVEPMVYIHGEVQIASAIPLRQAKTVAQALSQVGGIKREAKIEQLAIIRLSDDGYLKAITIDTQGSGQSSYFLAMQNMPLQAEDVIFIPESHRSQFVRAIQDFVNAPLGGLNQVLAPYWQFRLVDELENN